MVDRDHIFGRRLLCFQLQPELLLKCLEEIGKASGRIRGRGDATWTGS